jgi:hypothetical protein
MECKFNPDSPDQILDEAVRCANLVWQTSLKATLSVASAAP